MPMAVIMTEVIAAEAAAALAAEAAAAEAAKIAAAEVAAQAAAQQASQVAAQQAAQQAATSSAANVGTAEALNLAAQQQAAQQAGIMGIEGATASQPLTAEAVQQAAMNQGVQAPMSRSLSAPYSPLEVGSNPSAPFPEFFGQGQAMPPQGIADPSLAMQPQNTGFLNSPAVAPGPGPMQYQLNAPTTSGQGLRLGSSLEGITAPTTPMTTVQPPPSALETGMGKAVKFAKENPFTAMTLAYTGANALGLTNPSGGTFNDKEYDGPLSRIRLSPNFQGSTANPADFQYTPKRYAAGGIMGANSYDIPVGYAQGEMVDADVPEYARGGSLSDSIEKYQKMLESEPQAAPARSADVGIYYDQDPDTRYQDPFTAAQIRQAKVNQRAYVSPLAAKRPMPMGKLNLPTSAKSKDSNEVEAARGGIMQSSLGGYAAGGNPRLLKGPGDGMSDNIPATINGRQPARLADGEFVIPADVVSHLGNGSTEAGAKQLHAMMNKVRKARTGNSKQGKQIVAQKYLPEKKRA